MKAVISGLVAIIAMTGGAFAQSDTDRPDWVKSEFGPDDRLGAMNYLTPEKTAKASKLITTGKTYALGMITGRDTPALAPREYNVFVFPGGDGSGTVGAANGITTNDDMVSTYQGVGSQIDGFGHIGLGHRHYNGVHVSEFVTSTGLQQFGTENLLPVATRGILLDMTKHFDANPVRAGQTFNKAEIQAALAAADLTLEKGDIVIFHTGTMEEVRNNGFSQMVPGIGVEGAEFLAQAGVVAIGADTFCVEAIPFENRARPYDVHQTLLTKYGVYILENMVTEEMAADGVTEFFFTLGVPRLEGTVQAIINPVAIR
ncbi:MAG: polyketide cyclase [Ponticaulis sp.]|nr:polyketide cyclase [Ponticaulis sp.]